MIMPNKNDAIPTMTNGRQNKFKFIYLLNISIYLYGNRIMLKSKGADALHLLMFILSVTFWFEYYLQGVCGPQLSCQLREGKTLILTICIFKSGAMMWWFSILIPFENLDILLA